MVKRGLLSFCLFAAACEAEDAEPTGTATVKLGASCVADTPEAAAALCGASLTCLEERCVAPQGTPCDADADCGAEEACFEEEGVCRYDQARECPDPRWLEPLRCVDWDPQECPCYAGEIAFHEKAEGGTLSCAGVVGIFSDRIFLRQTGCHLEAMGGELVGDAVGFGEMRLRIAQLPNDTTCSAMADRWTETAGDPGNPAVRITCSATCRIWMEQFLALVPTAVVPSGTFAMGTPDASQPAGVGDEAPEHMVETSCFFMDQFEVSRGEYRECLKKGVCEDPDYAGAGQAKEEFFGVPADLLPVTSVTHRQAEQYCKFRDKALPSEADWERAARGAVQEMTTYPWGEEAPDCTRANLAGCGGNALPTTDGGGGPRLDVEPPSDGLDPPGTPAPAAVGSAGASHYGIYDLSGNVREWTRDFYDSRAYEERTLDAPNRNPETLYPGVEGPMRVVRGGSYLTPADGRALQASSRGAELETSSAADLGFRCVMYGTRDP